MPRYCVEEGCLKRCVFNYETEKIGKYCVKHKKEGMINVISKTCIYEGCKTIANFNVKEEKQGLYCVKHKLDGMIDVKNKRCKHLGCMKKSTYNFATNKQGLYCATHKLDGMVNVVSKTCIYERCKKIPNYNKEREKIGLYCVKHKQEGMIDVVNKTCIYKNCKTKPIYNVKGEKQGLYCATHKLDGMVNVKDKTCIHENCKKLPVFNVKGEKQGLYCATHKKEGMINVVSKTCKSDWCYTQVRNNKYKGYCVFCFIHLYPDEKVGRNYKTKETYVVHYIKEKYSQYDWVADKRIQDGCSRRRPDLLLDLGYQVIIVEVDENQHIDYDCSCENKRIMELSRDLDHRPIILIRFNPDDYININRKKISSCWGNNSKGLCEIKKSKRKEWENRLMMLSGQIDYWIENKSDKLIEVVQLFYDEVYDDEETDEEE